MNLRLLYFLLALSLYTSPAQHISKLGRFSIEYPKSCVPVTVHITEYDTFGQVSRQYIYDSETSESTNKTHTYTKPGKYIIYQYIGEDLVNKKDSLIFEALPSPLPDIELYTCSDNRLNLELKDNYYDFWKIKFSTFDSSYFTNPDTIISYSPSSTSGQIVAQGFFENAYNTCPIQKKNYDLSATAITDLESVNIVEKCLNNFKISTHFSSINTTGLYRISISGKEFVDTLYFGSIDRLDFAFSIEGEYNFYNSIILIEEIDKCDNSIKTFKNASFEIYNKSDNIQQFYASYIGDDILIFVPPSEFDTSRIYRYSTSNDGYSLISKTIVPIVDITKSIRKQQYLIEYTDSCSAIIDSIIITPPYIETTDINKKNNTLQLNIYSPKNQLGTYSAYALFYNDDSTHFKTSALSNILNLPPGIGSKINIRSVYVFEDSVQLFSNRITTTYEYQIIVPRAFTPNGDLLNDHLEFLNIPSENFQINIYDKWGNLKFQTTSENKWNGKFGNRKAPEGTYIYNIRFEIPDGNFKSQVGTFTLLIN